MFGDTATFIVVHDSIADKLTCSSDAITVKMQAGVTFRGEEIVGYRANLWLRSAIRVLTLLARGKMDPENNGATEVAFPVPKSD